MGKDFKAILKEKAERAERESRPRADWFSLKNGETKLVRFLQEFDTDMRNYDSQFGTAQFLVEHVSPQEWSRKALCSFEDEGRCFACEMDKEEPFVMEEGKKKWHPWGQKSSFYVYVVDQKGDVKVMSRPTNGKLFDALVDEIAENDNSLTDITFKLSKGSANQNPWEVRSTKKDHFELPEIAEVVDLSTVVGLKVPYADQKGFYLPAGRQDAPVNPDAPKSDDTKVGENW